MSCSIFWLPLLFFNFKDKNSRTVLRWHEAESWAHAGHWGGSQGVSQVGVCWDGFVCSVFSHMYSIRLLFYWEETLDSIIPILKWQCQGDFSKGFDGNWIWKVELCNCLVSFEVMLIFKIYVQKQAISIVVKWFRAKSFLKELMNRRSFQSSFFSCKDTNTNPTSLCSYNI